MKKFIILLIIVSVFMVGCQPNNIRGDDPNNGGVEVPENGGNDNLPEDDNSNKENNNPPNENNLGRRNYGDIQVSVQETFDIFMEKYPNARINEIELEFKDTTYEYEIEGYEGDTEYALKIDAFTKEIVKEEKSVESGEIDEIRKEDLDKIDYYVEEALKDASDGYWVKEWKLKVKSDYVKFEIELKNDNGDKIEYKYNYETGELLGKDD